MTNSKFIEICKKYAKDNKKIFHPKYIDNVEFLYSYFKKYCLEHFLNEDQENHIYEWLSANPDLMIDDLYEETNIVKKVCLELGITQKELADILKVNDGTIRQWSSKGEVMPNVEVTLNLLLENNKLKKQIEKLKSFSLLLEEIKQL